MRRSGAKIATANDHDDDVNDNDDDAIDGDNSHDGYTVKGIRYRHANQISTLFGFLNGKRMGRGGK